MPGVQAEQDGTAVEDTLDLVPVFDHGAHVRVQHGLNAAGGGDRGDPVEVGEQGLPAVVVEGGPGVVPVEAGGRGQDEGMCVAGGVPVEDAFDIGRWVVAGDMQEDRREAADRSEVVAVEDGRHPVRVGGQEPVGAEFGGGQSEVAHLGEDPSRAELVAPAGDFADAPGDGCAGDPVVGGHGLRTSSMRSGWRSATDFAQDSAISRPPGRRHLSGPVGHELGAP